MDTERIESIGVTAVTELALNSQFLKPYLDTNDRTPSWDGHIYLYSNETGKKDFYVGRVPVQIKSRRVKEYSGSKISRPIDILDLHNYKKDAGTVIFFVEFALLEKHIYYRSLLPIDLDNLLKSIKHDQQTKNIEFAEIRYPYELENICREFLIHRKLQYSLPLRPFPYDQIKELLITGVSFNDDFEKRILLNPHYLYGKTHLDSQVYEFVAVGRISEIKRTMNKPISIGIRTYYPHYQVIRTQKADTIMLGKNVEMIIQNNKTNINLKIAGDLDECTNDFDFVTRLIQEKTIRIGEQDVTLLGDGIYEEDEKKFKGYRDHLVNIAALLDTFKIEHNMLNLDDLSDEDWRNIQLLVDAIVLKHPAPEQPIMPAKYRFKVGDITLLTLIWRNEESKVEIHDINNPDLKLSIAGASGADIDASIFLSLKADDFLCSNVRLDEVMETVTNYSRSFEYANALTLLSLELIKAYDNTGQSTYLDSANELLMWLGKGNEFDENIININKLQVVRRLREFTIEEMGYLNSLKDISVNNFPMMCSICILLNDRDGFDSFFVKLTDDERKTFMDYPIYSLFQTLDSQ